jgi:hypothetical protein
MAEPFLMYLSTSLCDICCSLKIISGKVIVLNLLKNHFAPIII